MIERVASGSSVVNTVPPLDRNWCSRNANNGRPVCGFMVREPASRVALIAVAQAVGSCPVRSARAVAALSTVVGM